jgi:hypothetical protein
VRDWARLIKDGLPALCRAFEFTYESKNDRGVYDAINIAFGKFDLSQYDMMTWINADDMLDPAACRTAMAITSKFPDVRWLGGRTTLLDEEGYLTHQYPPNHFPRKALRSALFDGRFNHQNAMIQQEGTFWRPDLWLSVGGLNSSRYRLAGDFDLWRRFAEHCDYVTVDRAFGYFRRRSGQLSGDLASYHAEIDANLSEQEVALRSMTEKLYKESRTYNDLVSNGFFWRIAYYDHEKDGWRLEVFPQRKQRKRRSNFWQLWRPR